MFSEKYIHKRSLFSLTNGFFMLLWAFFYLFSWSSFGSSLSLSLFLCASGGFYVSLCVHQLCRFSLIQIGKKTKSDAKILIVKQSILKFIFCIIRIASNHIENLRTYSFTYEIHLSSIHSIYCTCIYFGIEVYESHSVKVQSVE